MAKKKITTYDPVYFGEEKEDKRFRLRYDDAKTYFMNYLKPRYDRSYKLFIAYGGDRAKEIQAWQSNIFVPYALAVVETMKPRILDARPEFVATGRNEQDDERAENLQKLNDYTWEIAQMDDQNEDVVTASMIYGSSWLETFYKKDVEKRKVLKGKNISKKRGKSSFVEKEIVHYDAPCAAAIDNYSLMYDWRNIPHESKQFWFKRLVLNGSEIKRRYPAANKDRLEMAFKCSEADLEDYGSIRITTKTRHEELLPNAKYVQGSDRLRAVGAITAYADSLDRYQNSGDDELRFHEVIEIHYPFEYVSDVRVNSVPIYDMAEPPNPYEHSDVPIIHFPFIRIPFEYEGLGYPLLLEEQSLALNLIKNQRFDATKMSIHKMWVVNPLASIKKDQLVVRPFGIIWSPDPNGVREIQFSDIKESAYREEELLKRDMRYASGVDDFSMGAGGSASSATEVRHLREATIERVRLFINHLGSGYSILMRHWISMYKQFLTDKIRIRITDEQGENSYRLIERDDIKGEFDFKATVLPSIAGKSDVDKKQNMDLFQLLSQLPFVDLKKLTSRTIHPWGWSMNSIVKAEEPMMPGMPGAEGAMPGMPGAEGAMPGMPGAEPPGMTDTMEQVISGRSPNNAGVIPPAAIEAMVRRLGGPSAGPQPMEATPFNMEGVPGTAGVQSNPRGMNRGGRVNTNIPTGNTGPKEAGGRLLGQSQNIQK